MTTTTPISPSTPLVLGSQSPRRRELLQLLVPAEHLRFEPPHVDQEAGFADLHTDSAIMERLQVIVSTKANQVASQLNGQNYAGLLTGDTIVVVDRPDGRHVLEKPPESDYWKQTVRNWFEQDYFGKMHEVITGIHLQLKQGRHFEATSRTRVTFHDAGRQFLEWYLSTNEPLGKAGGYGMQQAGSLFVEKIEGSLTNVIGLPLEATFELLVKAGLMSEGERSHA